MSHDLHIDVTTTSAANQFAVDARYKLIYFYSADSFCHVEGIRYPLTSGNLLLLRPLEAYTTPNSPCKQITFSFSARTLALIDPSGQLQHLLDIQTSPLYCPQKEYQTFFRLLLTQNIAQNQAILCVALSTLMSLPQPTSRHAPLSFLLQPFLQHINQHLTSNLDIDELCAQFNITRSYLYSRFKQITGTTLAAYIQTKRLFLARQLMDNGLSAHDACQQSGFADYSTFYRAYIKRFGVTPTTDMS